MGTYAAGDATKERIKEAARILFFEQGVTNVSDAAICRAAGVQRGLVAYHFGSRGQLVALIFNEFVDALQAAIDRRFDIDDPTLAYCVLEHLLLELLYRNEAMRRFYVGVVEYPEVLDEEVRVQHEQLAEILASREIPATSDRLKIAVAMSQGVFNETVRCIETGYLNCDINEIIDIDLMASMSLMGFDDEAAERIAAKTREVIGGRRLAVGAGMRPRIITSKSSG